MLGRSRTRIPVTFGLMWLVACLPAISSATTPRLWYQAKSRAIELTIATDEIGVRASDLGANSAAAERLGRILPSITLPTEPSSGLARLKLGAPAAGGDEVLRLVGALNDGSRHWVFSPVLRLGNARVVLTGEVLFRLHIDLEQSVLARMLSDVGLFEVRGPLAKYGVITAKLFDDSDPLAVLGASRRLAELPSVEFAHPNFVGALIESVLPNDTYFGSQWQFHNTGQTGGVSGADIQASDAWDVTTGSSSVTVAIVDAGVDITHPEFAGRLVTGYDATDGSNNSQPNAAESHGTACAGLALAAGNNGSGVAGVAWTAKLMPVRVSSNGITTDTQLADGILTAAFRGASVVSCSWEWGTPSPTLEFAINSALKNGRAGKGCVVVFASGDAGGGVGYPARLPGVISVGATNASDVRWSYSNFGPELTMVAPSGNHLTGAGLWTTDNRGSAGANPGSASLGDAAGDYTNQFDGTSAACPLVAGAAALALSVNGDLTASQVQATLTASATDLGAPGRDDQYGAGRLNVRAALGLLTSSVAVSGTLDANTVWHRGNVYKVLSDVFVPAGITLTIDAGTVIKFEPGRLLNVSGMLVSEGTVADPVVFTSYRDDSYGGDTNLDGASTGGPGDWQGVVLSGGNYTLQHCLLRYGGTYTLFNNAYGALVANGGFTGTIANNVVYAAYSGSAG
ncbi:MAG TPA: S8 family serine peptidase, partial [Candidatus Eisenbacteria bacterium]